MNIPSHSNPITATALIATLVGSFNNANAAEVPASMPAPVAMLAAPPTAASYPPPLDESQIFSVYGHWDSELISNLKGGIRTGSAFDSVAVGGVTLRGDNLGLPDTLLNVSVMGIRTGHANANLVGDRLGTSNIEGSRDRFLLDTAFWQQNWLTRPGFRFNTRLGMFDLNSEFTSTGSAAQLLNGSFGPDPSMTGNFTASTFPLNGTGLVATLDNGTGKNEPTGFAPLTVKIGLLQGESNQQTQPFNQGTLNIVEGQWRPESGTTLKLGLWRKRGYGSQNLQGAYLSGEHTIFSQNETALGGFIRASTVHSDTANNLVINRYLGAGINWQAPFAGRPDDFLTLGIGEARFHQDQRHERLVELAYIFQINHRVFLQPDLQYINRPSGTLPTAWVATLRLHIE
ncbi:carbohydrate porin [Halothiobacillus sp.]|uniref:carbohydrate porin n=1 Tax=Halothiobacillus sp. TaxID=1891311 RepID=UPI002AD48AB5|nr:carbohydrate porin [Halothiobacillus sp.]